MNPPPGIPALVDPMNEMYEFFAFDDALENGLVVDALIDDHAAQGQGHLANRMNQLIAQLNEHVDENERRNAELQGEARGLAPREARAYCDQLSQRVNELKLTESQQKSEFDKAEKATHEQNVQNASLLASIIQTKAAIKRQQEGNSHFQGQLYAAGGGLCNYVAHPNQTNRNGNDSRKYPSAAKPGSRGF